MQHGHMDVKKGETLKVCAERISQYGLQVLIWQLYLFVSGLLEWVKCMEGTVETNVKIVFFYTQFVLTPTCFDLPDHLQGDNGHH